MFTDTPPLFVWLLHDTGIYNDASFYTFVGPFDEVGDANAWSQQHSQYVTDWQLVRGDPQKPRILSPQDATNIYGNDEDDAGAN